MNNKTKEALVYGCISAVVALVLSIAWKLVYSDYPDAFVYTLPIGTFVGNFLAKLYS